MLDNKLGIAVPLFRCSETKAYIGGGPSNPKTGLGMVRDTGYCLPIPWVLIYPEP